MLDGLLLVAAVLVIGVWVDWATERRHQRDLERYIDSDAGEDGL